MTDNEQCGAYCVIVAGFAPGILLIFAIFVHFILSAVILSDYDQTEIHDACGKDLFIVMLLFYILTYVGGCISRMCVSNAREITTGQGIVAAIIAVVILIVKAVYADKNINNSTCQDAIAAASKRVGGAHPLESLAAYDCFVNGSIVFLIFIYLGFLKKN
jgi:hypothetical protein